MPAGGTSPYVLSFNIDSSAHLDLKNNPVRIGSRMFRTPGSAYRNDLKKNRLRKIKIQCAKGGKNIKILYGVVHSGACLDVI
jgi:hypothetical protein